MKRRVFFTPSLRFLTRAWLVCFVFLSSYFAGVILAQNRALPAQLSSHFFLSPTPQPKMFSFSETELFEAVNQVRSETGEPELKTNLTLSKLARLTALEIEDSQKLEIPESLPDLAKSLTPTPVRLLQALVVFSPHDRQITFASSLDASTLSNAQLTLVGVATRSATFVYESTPLTGTLGVIIVSSNFSTAIPQPQITSSKPQESPFTGQELWDAVQNYRQSHALPLFQKSNELCTVASIRVNQLLELGKLDNHAGFTPLSEQFFKDHPDWSAINENIAAGYQSGVQTVEWGWDQSLGHQALIQSREFPLACAAANYGFSVLVTGKVGK